MTLLQGDMPDQDWTCPDCGVPMRGPAGEPRVQCAPCASVRVSMGDLDGFVYGPGEFKRVQAAAKRARKWDKRTPKTGAAAPVTKAKRASAPKQQTLW